MKIEEFEIGKCYTWDNARSLCKEDAFINLYCNFYEKLHPL